jgi:mRNA-degrading endonuclease RelE of RelBE toxin-antitoxin system
MSDDEWAWKLSDRAADGLGALDADTQQRVLDKLDNVITDEFRDPADFAKPLTGAKPWQSLRVGDYRTIVRFDREKHVMQVGAVGHRSSIYDEFP